MLTKRERNFFRVMLSLIVLVAMLSLLGGCAAVRNTFGGESVGASFSLGALSIGVSAKIPLPQEPPPSPP